MSAFSLYIPGVYANITEDMIKKTFNRMKIGVVNRAILIPQANLKHNKAYIYFDEMYNTSTVSTMLSEIKEGSSKLFYARTPHVYWVMLENRRPIQDDEIMPATSIPNVEPKMIVDVEEDEEEEEEAPIFSEEEEAFVPIEDTSMVSSDYAAMLEYEIRTLRDANAQLQFNTNIMFEHYNQLFYTNPMLNAQLMHHQLK